MILIKKLFAICLLVDNLEKSIHFYRDILGLTLKTNENGFADFELGESGVALFQKDKATDMVRSQHMKSGGGAIIAFQVPNLQETHQELINSGATCIEEPKITPWGQFVAYYIDPDQHIIELSQ